MCKALATFETVKKAYLHLRSRGLSPSTRSIRREIGGGSLETIQRHLIKIRGHLRIHADAGKLLIRRIRLQEDVIASASATIAALQYSAHIVEGELIFVLDDGSDDGDVHAL